MQTVRVAVTPWELAFSVEAAVDLAKLVDTMPKGTVEWRDATLVVLTSNGKIVRAIELDANEPLEKNVDAWVRQPLASEAVKSGTMYFACRRAGTAASIATALKSLGEGPLLLAGGIDALSSSDCLGEPRRAERAG